ncbi:MAG: hypothetical protein QOC87_2264, partial [Actinomycetota bacterium]|nr:hypothetical protein [Actinomycetota bacterium]
LMTAYKVQKRAASLGFDANADVARARLDTAIEGHGSEPDQQDVGEALFWLVAVARAAGIDPEGALRVATKRFQESF